MNFFLFMSFAYLSIEVLIKKKSIHMNFLCSRDIKPFLQFAAKLFLCPIFVSLAFAIQKICFPSVKFTPVNKKGHI